MILHTNPLINWLRFCRYMTLGKWLLFGASIGWVLLFVHFMHPERLFLENQEKALAVASIVLSVISGMRLAMVESDGWEWSDKRNERYQKLIDEIEAMERNAND